MPINLDEMSHEFMPECIQVCKVYDWTTNVITIPSAPGQRFTFTTTGPNAFTRAIIEDVACEVTLISCSEDETTPRRDIECVVNDELVTLQSVTLRKTFSVRLLVTVTGRTTPISSTNTITVSVTEDVILCAPEGTTVCCSVPDQENALTCRTGALIFTPPTGTGNIEAITTDFTVRLCQNIVVTFDVILEVAARFCQPRPTIVCDTECTPEVIPPQCPIVFPTMG